VTLDTKTPVPAVESARFRSPRAYGSIVLGAVLVVVGGLWLFDAVGVIELRAAVVLPVALAVVGLALMVGSFDGPHTGLVIFGVFLTVAVVAAAVAPVGAFSGGIGERRYAVVEQASLASRYDVGVGDLRLDLRDLVLTESVTVDVTVGAGQMRIQLPADLPVKIDASVGAGQIDLLGQTADGLSVTRTYTSPGFDTAEVSLILDLTVAAGEIEVTR
jgi:predicted membrane protein